MIRRSFRAGLLLGVLAGAAGALKKVMESRRGGSPATSGPEAWPPLPDAEPVTVPKAPAPERSEVRPAPKARTEVHDGGRADEHFGDADRQPDVPTPDWSPADLQEAPAPAAPAKKKAAEKKGPAKKAAAKKAASGKAAPGPADTPWVEPDANGACPGSHPVKAKLSSKIFHLPGGLNYDRTQPDRCYVDPAAAEADGLRASKR